MSITMSSDEIKFICGGECYCSCKDAAGNAIENSWLHWRRTFSGYVENSDVCESKCAQYGHRMRMCYVPYNFLVIAGIKLLDIYYGRPITNW